MLRPRRAVSTAQFGPAHMRYFRIKYRFGTLHYGIKRYNTVQYGKKGSGHNLYQLQTDKETARKKRTGSRGLRIE